MLLAAVKDLEFLLIMKGKPRKVEEPNSIHIWAVPDEETLKEPFSTDSGNGTE